MTDPFVAEIRIVPFNFAPAGWALCTGQLLAIAQNTALFSLLGTVYGGDGRTTFALPDFRGVSPMGFGPGAGLSDRALGETGGVERVALTAADLAAHTHPVYAVNGAGTTNSASGAAFAIPRSGRVTEPVYASAPGPNPSSPLAFTTTGGDQPHNNLPPYLVLNFIIALQGIYPPRY